ncbi:MAG TPA: NAD-dependent epimerase/dehydratase family protein [Gammaproteobacteria bacterium]|nr:NAD-dependent epimerase/dehydratase family protein [Gammaproteobacteria bacterium]HIL98828.1 NAD-dependent epimerase/dehydratase family protein [Pseudomonadales bacterium]
MQIAVTGANGHLGIRLVESLLGEHQVRAIVRSGPAQVKLRQRFPTLEIQIVQYTDANQLGEALKGCDVVVHLVGIIKESKNSKFVEAHETSCEALVLAAAASSIQRIVYMSIVGTGVDSNNACLKSKARAEAILQECDIPAVIIKVPMVLGEGDFASFALRKNALSRFAFTFRANSLEQPIYAGDVIKAIASAIGKSDIAETVNLAGMESVTRKQLIQRAAGILHSSPVVVSLPISLGLSIAGLLEQLPNAPLSRAMLGVLDHDDNIDVADGCTEVGLELTPLDETLGKVLL